MKSFEVPILFLIFNRPETTRRVFEEIRRMQPARLFIAADGPRANNFDDVEKIRLAREIATNINWPCDVRTLFREKNLGSKDAISSAITWFFTHVDEGIILEDDCLPDPSFFTFCEELLRRYQTDTHVMMIGGFNMSSTRYVSASYFFSRYAGIWGWATWRRAWQSYDGSIASWGDGDVRKRVRDAIGTRSAWKIKRWLFDRVQDGTKKSWGYAWEFAILNAGGLSAVPNINLVENIGYGDDATRTTAKHQSLSRRRSSLTFPLRHPKDIKPNDGYDDFFIKTAFASKKSRQVLLSKNLNRIKRIWDSIKNWSIYAEMYRLRRMPRFKEGSTNIFGKSFLFVDGASFLAAYKEIFLTEIYKFTADSETPYILDCGANVGVSVLYLKKLYPRAKIVAFEPDPIIFDILKKNIEAFELTDVTLVNKALWNADTILSFAADGADGGHVVNEVGNTNDVGAVSLKPFLSPTVDFLKIDIEGAEDVVLEDIAPLLSRVRNLFVEYHSAARTEQELQNILDILNKAGFRYHVQSVGVRSRHPFESITVSKLGYDNQLNIFAYRP